MWVKLPCHGPQGPGWSELPPSARLHLIHGPSTQVFCLFHHPFHRSWSFDFTTEYLTFLRFFTCLVPSHSSCLSLNTSQKALPWAFYLKQGPFLLTVSVTAWFLFPAWLVSSWSYFICILLSECPHKLQRGRDCVWLVVLWSWVNKYLLNNWMNICFYLDE